MAIEARIDQPLHFFFLNSLKFHYFALPLNISDLLKIWMSRQVIGLVEWYQNEKNNTNCKDLQIHVHQGLGAKGEDNQ